MGANRPLFDCHQTHSARWKPYSIPLLGQEAMARLATGPRGDSTTSICLSGHSITPTLDDLLLHPLFSAPLKLYKRSFFLQYNWPGSRQQDIVESLGLNGTSVPRPLLPRLRQNRAFVYMTPWQWWHHAHALSKLKSDRISVWNGEGKRWGTTDGYLERVNQFALRVWSPIGRSCSNRISTNPIHGHDKLYLMG